VKQVIKCDSFSSVSDRFRSQTLCTNRLELSSGTHALDTD